MTQPNIACVEPLSCVVDGLSIQCPSGSFQQLPSSVSKRAVAQKDQLHAHVPQISIPETHFKVKPLPTEIESNTGASPVHPAAYSSAK